MALSDEDTNAAGGMDDATFAAAVGALAGDAVNYWDEDIVPDLVSATAYYRGDALGNEEEGRSQVVMTEVRDTILAMMPSLLRIFTGTEKAVEFSPTSPAHIEWAEQATDYINHLFYNENAGFRVLHNGFKDGLTRKVGVLHWWVEHREKVEDIEFTDLTQEEIGLLTTEQNVELLSQEEQGENAPGVEADPETGEPLPGEPLFTITVRRRTKEPKIRVATIPPEEFFISRDAHDEDDAAAIGRKRDLTLSELLAMGFDRDSVEAAGAGEESTVVGGSGLAQERNPAIDNGYRSYSGDPSQVTYTYFDAIVAVDRDGDGIAERRRVRGINPKNPTILTIDGEPCDEPWSDDAPFGLLCPDPEPHMAVGYSVADWTADLQEIKTAVVRNTLDSLANAIHPRTAIVEGQVNVDDALNTEVGAVIRMRAPGMVQPLAMPFVGQYALPLIQYLDQVRGNRTGQTDASNGLDADVLQSTTAGAVQNTVAKGQERVEMVARIFAETGLRRMFRGLLKLAVRHSDKARIFRLRGKYVAVDPRVWDADMDVAVNIGLGRGSDQDRMALYSMVAQKQEAILQLAGPSNPLAGLKEYRATLAKLLEIGGERDASRFFKEVDEAELQKAAAGQQEQPNPAVMLAQIEAQKAQVEAQKAMADAQLAAKKHEDEMTLRREELAQERLLKMAEIEARFAADIRKNEIQAAVQRERDTGQLVTTLHEGAESRAAAAEAGQAEREHRGQQADADRAHKAQEGAAGRVHAAVQADHERSHRSTQADADRQAAPKPQPKGKQ